MTLEELLREKTVDELRELLDHALPAIVAAVQAELDSRPSATRGGQFLRSTFPARPDFPGGARVHGTGCPPGCCGAGVRQWR